LLASGSDDGAVRIFDDQGGLRAVLKAHAGPISRIAWSADGKSILTAGEDGVARVQPVDRDDVIDAVRRGALRQLTLEERTTYLGSPP
jgi:WD40 repeat protein